MKCLLAFYCTLPVWSRASFGTQLGNHPPGMIGPRLLGVDKSVSSIRVTVIKCFRGCTRLLAAVATTKIYAASVETMPREPMIREKLRVRVSRRRSTTVDETRREREEERKSERASERKGGGLNLIGRICIDERINVAGRFGELPMAPYDWRRDKSFVNWVVWRAAR